MPYKFLDKTYKKNSKAEKEDHHQILHIWDSLDAKFELKLTISFFG